MFRRNPTAVDTIRLVPLIAVWPYQPLPESREKSFIARRMGARSPGRYKSSVPNALCEREVPPRATFESGHQEKCHPDRAPMEAMEAVEAVDAMDAMDAMISFDASAARQAGGPCRYRKRHGVRSNPGW